MFEGIRMADAGGGEPSALKLLTSVRFVLLFLLTATAAWSRPVLLISLDGVRPDFVTRADARGLKVPNLRRFLREGTYAEGVTGVVPTVTYPSHTTLLTGAWPAQHGILSNAAFDPMQTNMGGWNWYASDIRAPTLLQAADRAGIATASVFWSVSVAAPGVRYLIPEYWRARTSDDLKLLRALGRPENLIPKLEAKLGPLLGLGIDTIETDENHTRFALEILQMKRPGFMTVHLTCFDGYAHEHGPFSEKALAGLEALDGMVGRLRDAALAIDPTTVVVVVSDHGFAQTNRRFNWKIPFVDAGLLTLTFTPPAMLAYEPGIADWQATLWTAGGMAAVILKDPANQFVKAKVKNLLETLKADPKNGIARLLEAEEAKKLGGFPDAAFLLELEPDCQFGGALSGAMVVPGPSAGMHGYLPDRPEMRACFFAMGKGIAVGRNLGVVDMRRIAPTVAAMLGVNLPTAKEPKLEVEQK